MTTKFLDNKICTSKSLLSWRLPRKTAFLDDSPRCPQMPPLKKRKFLFLLSSRRLRVIHLLFPSRYFCENMPSVWQRVVYSIHRQCVPRYGSLLYCDTFAEVLGSGVVGTLPVWAIVHDLWCCCPPSSLVETGETQELLTRFNREQKLNTNFFFSNFSGAPRISRQNPGISRPKSLWFPWLRGTYRTFWPPPVHLEDPYPTGKYPDQKVWVWVPFSSLI